MGLARGLAERPDNGQPYGRGAERRFPVRTEAYVRAVFYTGKDAELQRCAHTVYETKNRRGPARLPADAAFGCGAGQRIRAALRYNKDNFRNGYGKRRAGRVGSFQTPPALRRRTLCREKPCGVRIPCPEKQYTLNAY